MEDALTFAAVAAAGFSLALVLWVASRWWLRAKEIERATDAPAVDAHADLAGILKQIDARLSRLERSVDATAIEVERVSEAQRFAARAIVAPRSSVTH